MRSRGSPSLTNRSKMDSSGILPSDRDLWETVDTMDGTTSAQKFIVSQLSYYARGEWRKLMESLSVDERACLRYAWRSVPLLAETLQAECRGSTLYYERAAAAIVVLQERRFLVQNGSMSIGPTREQVTVHYYARTSAAKMVAALLESGG